VLVIDSGRQVFFGPTTEARAYFEGLGFREKPRQTTPDYLTGCTDPFEREFKDGRDAENVPSTPGALVEAFEQSPLSKRLDEEMQAYRAEIGLQKQIYDDFEIATKSQRNSRQVFGVLNSFPPADLGINAASVPHQMARQICSNGVMDDFHRHRHHPWYCVAQATKD
jgi:hypothetical protein